MQIHRLELCEQAPRLGEIFHATRICVLFSDRVFAVGAKQEFLHFTPVGIYSCYHYPLILIYPHRQNM